MRRALLVFVLAAFAGLAACGGTTRSRGAFPAGSTVVRTSGFVSLLQFTTIQDSNGKPVDVTLVTLVNSGFAADLTFCGEAVSFFPVNAFVEVSFIPATPCSSSFTSKIF